jgi:hypothetical protein
MKRRGLPDSLNILSLARVFVLVVLTALTLISMIFLVAATVLFKRRL